MNEIGIITTTRGDRYRLEPYMKVVNGRVFNNNTQRFEALGGDYVIIDGKSRMVKVTDLTDGQVVPTEDGTFIVGGGKLDTIHYYEVEKVIDIL